MYRENTNISFGSDVMIAQAQAVKDLALQLGQDFDAAVRLILNCPGVLITTGIGKSGIISQKISATLASTGTRSFYVHPSDGLHGDLGRISTKDTVLILSYGGESSEIVRLAEILAKHETTVIGVTSSKNSTLGRWADVTVPLGSIPESCPLGLAPTTTTTCMLALGDALAMAVMRKRGFTESDYAGFHPGGALGQRLTTVEQKMKSVCCNNLPVVNECLTVREALLAVSKLGKRSGALMVVNNDNKLVGIFTDADLRRLLVKHADGVLEQPIRRVMSSNPHAIECGQSCREASSMFDRLKIDEIPVTNDRNEPIGLLDIHDLI